MRDERNVSLHETRTEEQGEAGRCGAGRVGQVKEGEVGNGKMWGVGWKQWQANNLFFPFALPKKFGLTYFA